MYSFYFHVRGKHPDDDVEMVLLDPNESTQDGTVETNDSQLEVVLVDSLPKNRNLSGTTKNSNTDNSSDVRITKCNALQIERFVYLLIKTHYS